MLLFGGDCIITEEVAKGRVIKYLEENGKPLQFLSEPIKKDGKCEVWLAYKGNGEDLDYIVTDWGRLHFSYNDKKSSNQ